MRISELASKTGVTLPSLKYYLRVGVLMPGDATGRTRAEYDERHVERVRLIRALIESGGLGIAGVRAVVGAIENPPESPHDFLGTAHSVVPPPVEPSEPTEELEALVRELGWSHCVESRLVGSLARAVADVRAAGIALPSADLRGYAKAALHIAEVDVAAAVAAPTPEAALHTVVVGTVMVDSVIVLLRRLAQGVVSARALSAPDSSATSPPLSDSQ